MASSLVLVVLLALVIAGSGQVRVREAPWRIHTLFSTECKDYFDWQTVGIMHSFIKARQPGPITRLLSCTDEAKKKYKGMDLAPTLQVPSMSRHPKTGDWYPAINKPAGVVHWLKHSKDAQNVDWVVILDADMIIRGPIIPWELGVERGRPIAAYYGYLIGCDNILAKLHTVHPELCEKVGGLLAFHIDDLRALAPLWLSKTEEVRNDRAHWATNITGDIYGEGWISEMYGYSFGAAEVGLRHKITDDLMIYPGYVPREGVEPILFHYGLEFTVGNWSFSKLEHHDDTLVYDCGRLFPEPPFPREVKLMESDPNKLRGMMFSIECVNTLNEALLLHHAAKGCPKPKWTRYMSFLKSRTFSELTQPKTVTHVMFINDKPEAERKVDSAGEETTTANSDDKPEAERKVDNSGKATTTAYSNTSRQSGAVDSHNEKLHPKIHTIFSTECTPYFDWQTVGLIHSFHLSGQPGNITRLLSCSDEALKGYSGHDLAPTHYVPSMSRHPLTGDWYPAINKPAAVLHWLNHAQIDAEFIVILDADMVMKGPITPWEFKAARGHPVSTPYDYLIGCDNELAKLHTSNPKACDKVGGVIIMHIEDLRKFAMLWLHKTEEVRADKAHYATNITGDIYESGWISEMYGYSFGAAELNLRHLINPNILIYPGYVPVPGVSYRILHYGLEFSVGTWSFDKARWRDTDMVNKCWAKFPDPPDPSTLDTSNEHTRARDLLSIECMRVINEGLLLHHRRRNCDDPAKLTTATKSNVVSDTIRSSTKNRSDNDSEDELKATTKNDPAFSSFRFWIVGLWVISFLGFLLLTYSVFYGGKRRKKGKHQKSKRRMSYPGNFDSNGIDRHLKAADVSEML